MSATISIETGKWLQSQRVLPRKELSVYPAPGYEDKMFMVNKNTWNKFQNGYAIAALLKKYESKNRGTSASQNDVMDTLKEAITPVAKLFNWNVVAPILEHHNIPLTDEDKARIVAGDDKKLVYLIDRIKKKFEYGDGSQNFEDSEMLRWENEIGINNNNNNTAGDYNNNMNSYVNKNEPASPEYNSSKKKGNNDEILFNESRMSYYAPVLPLIPLNSMYEREATSIAMSKSDIMPKDGAKTIIEFIIMSITKAFKINSQGAALMLTVHAPRLAGLCIDGPRKGVVRWLNNLSSPIFIDRLLLLLAKRPKDLSIFLGIIRPCLHSQNPSIAMRAAKLFTTIIKMLRKKNDKRKRSGMLPSSKSAPIIGMSTIDNNNSLLRSPVVSRKKKNQKNNGGDLSKNSPKKKSSPNKKKQSLAYATRAKLVQNKGDKKAVARILQEEAKSKARTTLETAMHEAWLWFVNNNGIGSSLNALETHPTIAVEIVEMVIQLTEGHFKELFQVHLRKVNVSAAPLLTFFDQFLIQASKSAEDKKALQQHGLLKNITAFALELSYSKQSNNNLLTGSNNSKRVDEIGAVQLLLKVWLLFPDEFIKEADHASRVLALLRKQCRASDTSTVMTALSGLFDICEVSLGIPKPRHQDFASRTYKMLIFSLIESISVLGDSSSGVGQKALSKKGNSKTKSLSAPVAVRNSRKRKEYQDDPNAEVTLLRSFIALNMRRLFKAPGGTKLPVDVLIEPFVRQISIHGYNVEDLSLLASLAGHPRLPLKQAVLMMDLLAKVSITDLVYSRSASSTLVNVAISFVDETAVRRYLVRLAKVAIGVYVKAEEKALAESRTKNLHYGSGNRGRRSRDSDNDYQGRKGSKNRSKKKGNGKEEQEYSDEIGQQLRIFDLITGLITCDSIVMKQNLLTFVNAAIRIVTNLHKNEATRITEMKAISDKSKRIRGKGGKGGQKNNVDNVKKTVGMQKLQRLMLILKDEIEKVNSGTPLLNGNEDIDTVDNTANDNSSFSIENASFNDLKNALQQFNVNENSQQKKAAEKEQDQSMQDDTLTSTIAIDNADKDKSKSSPSSLPAIQKLANGPREASLLRTPSPSYNTRNPRRSNKKYLKAAKQRQSQGKIAVKAKKAIDLIAEKTEERRRRRLKAEEAKKKKEETLMKQVRNKYVKGRNEYLLEKEVKEVQEKEVEQAIAKYNLKVEVDPKKILEDVELQDADVLHAKAKAKQFARAEKFLLAELMQEDAKARAMLMVNEGRCEVPRREKEEFQTLNQRFKRCARLLFNIFTSRGGADAQRLLTFEEVRRSNLTIDLGEWLIMLNKLELYPPLDKMTLTAIFHKALNHLRGLGMEIDEQELDYTGFLTAIRILVENFACAGLIVEDIDENGDGSEMALRMKQWSLHRKQQSLRLPFDNWERFWEWFKDGAETKLKDFGVKKKHLDDLEMKRSLEKQQAFIDRNLKRRASLAQDMEAAREEALATGKIKEKEPDRMERLQGFGSTLKIHEDELKLKKKKITIRKKVNNKDIYGNIIDEERYGYGHNTLETLPVKSKRAGKEMLCYVEALIEITVSRSHQDGKSYNQLAKEATSIRARNGLLEIIKIRKQMKEKTMGMVTRNELRKKHSVIRNVYIKEKAQELFKEEEEKKKVKQKERKEMLQKKKKNTMKLKKIKEIKKKKEDQQLLEKQKLKEKEQRARQKLLNELKVVQIRNEERERKRKERLEDKTRETEKIKEIQQKNIETLLKTSVVNTDEFQKARDAYRREIKREQMAETKRRGEARLRAVRLKKEKKERELAELNRPKRPLPEAVKRRRKAEKVMYKAAEKQQERDKEKDLYLRKVGGRGNVAAVHIQKAFRGYNTRENLDDKKQKVMKERKAREQKKRDDAAVKIQKIARGNFGKKRVDEKRMKKEFELKKAEEEQKRKEEEENTKKEREKAAEEALRLRNEELTRKDRAKARRKRAPATNEDAEERAREFFKDEWSNYDLDADGFLNALEFKHLVETISKKKLLLPECERFLAYIDKNGDNLLEIEELVTFIVKGMAINDNQRKAWKNKSPLHSKLLHFIDSVARVI